jgi:hypothetical protein
MLQQNGQMAFKPLAPRDKKYHGRSFAGVLFRLPYGTLIFDQYKAVDWEVMCPHGWKA